jgi:hypothetical protein
LFATSLRSTAMNAVNRDSTPNRFETSTIFGST